MKTQLKTLEQQLDTTIRQLTEKCDTEHKNYLDRVKKIAFELAQSGLPKQHDGLSPFVEEITGHYEAKRNNVLLELASSIQDMRIKVGVNEPMIQINEKREQLKNLIRVLNLKQHDHDAVKIERDVKDYKLYSVILWVIALFESIFLALVFSGAFGDSNLLVVAGALVFSFSLVKVVKIVTLKIRDSKRPIHWFYKLCVILLFVAVVSALGLIRFLSVIISSDNTIVEYKYISHPLIFIFLTAVPIIATALISWKYLLSDDDLKQLREKEKIASECNDQKKHIKTCENEIEELTRTRNDIVNSGIKAEHAEKVLINRFDNYIKESIGVFKLENIKHRMDNVYPDCFNETSPQLSKINDDDYSINYQKFVHTILFALSFFTLVSCNKKNIVTARVLIDITDENINTIKANELISLITKDNQNAEIDIGVQTISQYRSNRVTKYSIDKESLLLGNSTIRKRKLNTITQSIEILLDSIYSNQTSQQKSAIFLPFIDVLNELAEDSNSKKIVAFESDLQENTKTFSCYQNRDINTLQKEPDVVLNKLLQGKKLPNLDNTTIYFIHAPRSQIDDELFFIMAEFYKQFLERQGAKVYIQNNIISQ